MKEKQKLAGEVSKRYLASGKREKTVILNEFVKNTGYNKKYASTVLAHYGRLCQTVVDGKPAMIKADSKVRRKGGGRKKKYGEDVFVVIRRIWEFFDYQCGTLLAPLIRLMIDFLAGDTEFGITDEIKSKVMTISASTIDRGLKPERKKLEIKGKSLTKPGKLLKHQVPVRTYFAWDERKPGNF